MTETTLALAEALCRAQEAAQSLSEVAPTTADHWQGVAVRAHAYLLKSGWRITSAPEAADSEVAQLAERPLQGSPLGEVAGSRPVLGVEAAIKAALEGLRAEVARLPEQHDKPDWSLASRGNVLALIDARLGR